MADLKIGDLAPGFKLPGVDSNTYSLEDFKEKKIIIVMFSCNHCPTVQAYEERFVELQRDYKDKGVALVAINSNDDKNYPEDSFKNMKVRAERKRLQFSLSKRRKPKHSQIIRS